MVFSASGSHPTSCYATGRKGCGSRGLKRDFLTVRASLADTRVSTKRLRKPSIFTGTTVKHRVLLVLFRCEEEACSCKSLFRFQALRVAPDVGWPGPGYGKPKTRSRVACSGEQQEETGC